MYEFPADEELYMDCYEDECPFWGAIGMVYNVDNGLYQETETGCRRAKKEWNSVVMDTPKMIFVVTQKRKTDADMRGKNNGKTT